MGFEQPYIYYFVSSLLLAFTSLSFGLARIVQLLSTDKTVKKIIFPAHKWSTLFMVVFLFQLPYTLNVYSESGFIYALAFDETFYLPLVILCWERYFYLKSIPIKRVIFILLLPVLFLSTLFFSVVSGSTMIEENKDTIRLITTIILAIESFQAIWYILRTYLIEIKNYKMEYSNEEDFPFSKAFAMSIVLVLCFLVVTPEIFLLNRDYKMFRDIFIIFIFFAVGLTWMFVYRRKNIPIGIFENNANGKRSFFDTNSSSEEMKLDLLHNFTEISDNKLDLSDMNFSSKDNDTTLVKDEKNELLTRIKKVILENELYKNPRFSMNDLLTYIPTNRTYLSHALSQSEEGNFYRLVLTLRINFAKDLLINDVFMKIEDVARKSGFTSQSFFSRSFKQETGTTPTQYRNINTIE